MRDASGSMGIDGVNRGSGDGEQNETGERLTDGLTGWRYDEIQSRGDDETTRWRDDVMT